MSEDIRKEASGGWARRAYYAGRKQGREGVKRSLPCLFVGLLIAVRTLQYRSTGRRRCACEMLQAGVRTTDIDAWESFLLLREGLESGKSTG